MRCVPWSIGALTSAGHHGWSPSILVHVSNILESNSNGKLQLVQPVGRYVGGSVVGVQIARNPGRPLSNPSDLNVTVKALVLEMMVHG